MFSLYLFAMNSVLKELQGHTFQQVAACTNQCAFIPDWRHDCSLPVYSSSTTDQSVRYCDYHKY